MTSFMPPPSYAMDACAGGGGPSSTSLPQIVTGNPMQILAQVAQLASKITQFTSTLQQFQQAQSQLGSSWSGGASASALQKLSSTLQLFGQIIKVMQLGNTHLTTSAGMVQTAQTGYQSVVGAVNPSVASMMSNPWTYPAACALATSSSATLNGFVQAQQGLLTALGTGQMAQQVTSLVSIIGSLSSLMSSLSSSSAASAAGSTPLQLSNPVTAPPPTTVVNPIATNPSTGLPLTNTPNPAFGTPDGPTPTNTPNPDFGTPNDPSGPTFTNELNPDFGTPDGIGLISTSSTAATQPGWVPVDTPATATANRG